MKCSWLFTNSSRIFIKIVNNKEHFFQANYICPAINVFFLKKRAKFVKIYLIILHKNSNFPKNLVVKFANFLSFRFLIFLKINFQFRKFFRKKWNFLQIFHPLNFSKNTFKFLGFFRNFKAKFCNYWIHF